MCSCPTETIGESRIEELVNWVGTKTSVDDDIASFYRLSLPNNALHDLFASNKCDLSLMRWYVLWTAAVIE